jgi:hypothetical protein
VLQYSLILITLFLHQHTRVSSVISNVVFMKSVYVRQGACFSCDTVIVSESVKKVISYLKHVLL